jgi:hypothetical protein
MAGPQEQPGLVCSIDVSAGMNVSPGGSPSFVANELVSQQLDELIGLCRELVGVSREQLELARRAEDRFQKQQQAQREEFERWLNEYSQLPGRCRKAEETVRNVLGQAMSELVDYVEEHHEDLMDSEFVRSELVDRYGSLLNHVSAMYAVLKRLSIADQQNPGISTGG